jgi:hypothetical protein
LTEFERNCFNALVKVVGDKYWVFPQVHFSAFLNQKVIGQSWRGAFSHVNGKSVDFLLCTKETLLPTLAIELDDTTHESYDRRARDIEEERMFNVAGVPLLRLQHYDSDNLDSLSKK